MPLEDLTPDERKALNLGRELLANPEVRMDAFRLAKKANPKLNIAEIDLEDKIAAVNDAALKREGKLEEQLMTERVQRRKSERDAQIIAAGYTVADIEKIIVDEHCSYETAMKIADLQARTGEPTADNIRGGHVVGEAVEMRPEGDWRKLNGAGLRKKSAQVASELISGFRNSRRLAPR
jgi:hypothetical protein